ANQLLSTMLRDKETHAISRVMRILGLLFPKESFDRIQRGLYSKDAKARASSRELLENLLKSDMRDSIVGLIDDVPDRDRLGRALPQHRPGKLEFADLMAKLIQRTDELGALAAYHGRELGIVSKAPGEDSETMLASHLADRSGSAEVLG